LDGFCSCYTIQLFSCFAVSTARPLLGHTPVTVDLYDFALILDWVSFLVYPNLFEIKGFIVFLYYLWLMINVMFSDHFIITSFFFWVSVCAPICMHSHCIHDILYYSIYHAWMHGHCSNLTYTGNATNRDLRIANEWGVLCS
jgi:hypothetical protein